jgi:hypothetical protein
MENIVIHFMVTLFRNLTPNPLKAPYNITRDLQVTCANTFI